MSAFVSFSLPGNSILPSGSGTLQVRQKKRWSLKMRMMKTWKVSGIQGMTTQMPRLCRELRHERNSCARSSRLHHQISVLRGKSYFIAHHWTSLLCCLTCSLILVLNCPLDFQVKLRYSRLWGLLCDCQISGLHEAICSEFWYLFITGKKINLPWVTNCIAMPVPYFFSLYLL